LLAACAPAPRPATTPSGSVSQPAAAAQRQPPRVDWFEDDASAAFASALARKQLVLVDLWAPWCHTCLSMRQQVLKVEAVPELADLVPLAIDTENAVNERFLQEYPVGVWPTFYLLDARTRAVRGRWLGGASPAQLSRWLRDSSRTETGPLALLRDADALAAKRRFVDAAARYREALAAAPSLWPRRPETLVALLSALSKQRNYAGCLQLAVAEAASLPPSVSAVDFASLSVSCAEHAKEDGNASQVRQLAERIFSRDCAHAAPGASPDDQADACGNLRSLRQSRDDRAGARQAAEQALSVISPASAGAPPRTQLIYDWERTSSLVYLGRAQEALTLLHEREQALPDSYVPPHYLARVYRELGEWEKALASLERALSRAYGPRRAGLLGLEADLLNAAGRPDEARLALERQLAEYRALPAGQAQPDAQAAVEQRLEKLGSSAKDPSQVSR
jgi:thioredoxin-like negative regulator of GroEL